MVGPAVVTRHGLVSSYPAHGSIRKRRKQVSKVTNPALWLQAATPEPGGSRRRGAGEARHVGRRGHER